MTRCSNPSISMLAWSEQKAMGQVPKKVKGQQAKKVGKVRAKVQPRRGWASEAVGLCCSGSLFCLVTPP